MTDEAYELLLAMTLEMRAKVILELKRRRDGGLVLRKPKPTKLASSASVESDFTSVVAAESDSTSASTASLHVKR
jgi:hypothetical protein